ncbi:MAG TPA: FtsQ-type POTRA domain-containing protein [Thermoleophilia bacterium]|nr:FtsQ-type POTRA domain-containing protein [Thermoleophilia bacterium]
MLLTLAILAVPTAVYAWGRTSSSFGIATIRVAGTHLVPEKRVLRLLREEYAGRNLFGVTGGDVRKTLAPLCFVRGARIDRDFPETLAVTITEYEPAAYALAGDRWYVVDRDGYVICSAAVAAEQLAKKPAKKPSPSPTASSAGAVEADAAAAALDPGEAAGDGGSEQPGSVLERLIAGPGKAALALPRMAVTGKVREGRVVSDEAAAEMLSVIAALPRSLQRSLTAVQHADGQLTLRFAGGPVTTWGDAERTLAKSVALRTVLREYADAGKRCTQLDVSIPDRTLAKPVLQ